MVKRSRERTLIGITFLTCCVSVALLSVSFGTKSWLSADCTNFISQDPDSKGSVAFGLFAGDGTFNILNQKDESYKIVCLEHKCMYSFGETDKDREDSLDNILHSRSMETKNQEKLARKSSNENLAKKSEIKNLAGKSENENLAGKSEMENLAGKSENENLAEKPSYESVYTKNYFDSKRNSINDDKAGIKINNYLIKYIFRFLPSPIDEVDSDTAPELMSQGLWIATIALLSGALLFAIVGSIFAVINTATTPIEFITGVPGLYIWNSLAAVLGLACVICWGVQYSAHLTSNVLIEDAAAGWTTEGMEHLGYSYWLVVGAVLIHLANIAVIAVGTYERVVKAQYEAPDIKPGNIMLY